MKKSFIFSLFVIFIISQMLVYTGCANIVPPSGGDRDSIAPVLLKVSPPDSTLNFNNNRIVFTFDEYVDVQNTQQELLVSPTPKQTPEVSSRLNTVTVRLKDTLEANTTYTIEFGNIIKDINESNVLRNFNYTFSTGPYIDSLQFSGKVILAETGKPDTTLIVMLHSSPDDSALVREKPRYVTRLDGNGNFTFRNLPPRTYYLYALKDEGGSRRYFGDKRQLFAFADSAVVISSNVKPVTLYAYAAQEETNIAAPPTLLPGGQRGRGTGAGNTPADRRLRFSTTLTNNQQDLLNDLVISFEQPLKIFDSTKVGFFSDSTFTPVASYRLVKDSSNKKLKLTTAWKENTTYHLILDKDFAEDSTGKKLLRTDTLSFATKKIADYGEVSIRFRNLDLSKNPVLLFVINNTITQSFPLTSADFQRTLFLPGDYELRILYDDNKNGKWDAGEFFGKHRQPELVKPIDRKVIIKPGWKNEFEIESPL